MRVVLILACVLVAVYAESCSAPADCSATTCGSNAELHCIDGLCTCTTAGSGDGGCVNTDDCHGGCHHGGRHHCIDGRCRCTHF
uniref:Uncharacterized protein n=1 Tax=Magallana gigas TaxID=29159 RepID=A0A8W8KZ73_MAGGI|nr:serine protease inhibitor Cvsi-2-like [Crassostrea gigas]